MPTKLRRWTLPVTSIALALVALTGCADAKPISPPKPTTEPVFASEAEALAAVTETFQKFLSTTNAIVLDQGLNPERIATVASPEQAEIEYEAFERIRNSGMTWGGSTTLVSVSVQTWSHEPDARGFVATGNICVDVSGTEVMDAAGTSVVPADRQTLLPFAVGIAIASESTKSLVVASKEIIEGTTTCE